MGLNGSGNWTETECYSVIELIVQSSWGQDWSRWKTRKTGETETFTQYFIISQINTFSECELSISANVLSKIMVAHMTYYGEASVIVLMLMIRSCIKYFNWVSVSCVVLTSLSRPNWWGKKPVFYVVLMVVTITPDWSLPQCDGSGWHHLTWGSCWNLNSISSSEMLLHETPFPLGFCLWPPPEDTRRLRQSSAPRTQTGALRVRCSEVAEATRTQLRTPKAGVFHCIFMA